MTLPNFTRPEVRVLVWRSQLSHLVDSDGVPIVDVDGGRFLLLPETPYAIDLTDRVRSGSVSLGDVSAIGSSRAGVDATVAVLNLTLDLGDPSLAPGVKSVLNEPDELLRPYRMISVEARAGEHEEWRTIFAGYLGDEVRTNVTASSGTISLSARDLAKPLQDTFLAEFPVIAADAETAPVPVEDALTELIALVPANVRPPLAFPSGLSGFMIREPYQPQNCSVWDAMQQLALQVGWYLGVMGSELVFMDPPRGKETADLTLSADDVFIDDLGVSDTDIRNVVEVVWTDKTTLERRVTEARDQWSIDNLTGGVEKRSVLELDATSQIDTQTEAETLAARFIADMAREFASSQVTLPFTPSIGLFTTIALLNPRVDQAARFFAVHSVKHTWDRRALRTVIAGVGQVIGKRRAWLAAEPRPGSRNDPRGPHQSVLPPPIVTVEPASPGFTVTIEPNRGVDAVRSEIHWSLVNGFIPGPSTLKAEGNQERWTFNNTDAGAVDFVQPGLVHYVRVRSIDSQGNPGRFTTQRAVTPGSVEGAWIEIDNNTRFSGAVEITNAERTTGALSVKTSAGVEVARLGNISGKPGVPAGAQFGLWGALGAGVYIEGVPRIVYVRNEAWAWSLISIPSSVPAGHVWSFDHRYTERNLPAGITVPEGYRLQALAIPRSIWASRGSPTEFDLIVPAYELRTEVRRSNGTWTLSPQLDGAGTTYDRARVYGNGRLRALAGVPAGQTVGVQAQVTVMLVFIPQDASAN